MSRILLVSDLHQRTRALRLIDDYLSKNQIDLVICVGDLTNRDYGSIKYAKDFCKIIKNRNVKLFYIHGNNEPQDVIDFLKDNEYSIHLVPRKYLGKTFIGIGGFMDEWDEALSDVLSGAILVTHYPPAIADLKFRNIPRVHISGHRHRLEERKEIGGIVFISVPSLGDFDRVAILKLPGYGVDFTSI